MQNGGQNKHERVAPAHFAAGVSSPAWRSPIAWFSQLREDLEGGRFFITLPFLIIFGLCAYAGLAAEPVAIALWVIAALLLAALAALRRQIGALRFIGAAICCFLGFVLLPIHGAFFGTPMLNWPVFGTFEMTVTDVLGSGVDKRIVVSNIQPLADARSPEVRRARLFVRKAGELHVGDRLRGKVRFAPVPAPVVPGGFDAQFHGYFDGVGAYGNSTGALTVIAQPQAGPLVFIAGVRQSVGQQIDLALSVPINGISRALIIGDQSQISDETRATMAAAGLAHVLAISGLHLTLVAGGVYFAIRLLLAAFYGVSQRWPIKKIAAIAGILAALIYLGLSGASVSATRATVMLILVFGAVLAGRRALTMRNVALAAIFVLIVDPASIFRASFQLSFSAVVALVGTYEMVRSKGDKEQTFVRRIVSFYLGLATTSLIAGLATALFAAYHFQQVAPFGVLGNLLALPLVAFIVLPSGFMSVLLMPLGLAHFPLMVMGWGIERIIDIAEGVASLSMKFVDGPSFILAPAALFIALAAFCWFAVLRGRKRLLGFVVLVPLMALVGFDHAPDVLIADTTQAVAINFGTEYALLAGRKKSFAVDVWAETYRLDIVAKAGAVHCDSTACLAVGAGGFHVSLVKKPSAFAEDCRSNDLIITRLEAPRYCRQLALVIDRDDLRLRGSHRLDWDERQQTFIVTPAIPPGQRPWRLAP